MRKRRGSFATLRRETGPHCQKNSAHHLAQFDAGEIALIFGLTEIIRINTRLDHLGRNFNLGRASLYGLFNGHVTTYGTSLSRLQHKLFSCS